MATDLKNYKLRKIRIHDEQKKFLEKKNAFIVLKGIFNNVGVRKSTRR